MTSKVDALSALRGRTHYVLADGTVVVPSYNRENRRPVWENLRAPTQPYMDFFLHAISLDPRFAEREIAFEVYDDEE